MKACEHIVKELSSHFFTRLLKHIEILVEIYITFSGVW